MNRTIIARFIVTLVDSFIYPSQPLSSSVICPFKSVQDGINDRVRHKHAIVKTDCWAQKQGSVKRLTRTRHDQNKLKSARKTILINEFYVVTYFILGISVSYVFQLPRSAFQMLMLSWRDLAPSYESLIAEEP